MSDEFSRAAVSLPPTLQDYVAIATGAETPRALPPAERIVRQLLDQIKAALATRGTGDDRSFELDVTATLSEEKDLATALWALHKCGYSAVVNHLAHGRRVVTLNW